MTEEAAGWPVVGGRVSTPKDRVLPNLIRSSVAPIFRTALRAACRVVPKDGSVVLHCSPDLADTVRAMAPALVASGKDVTLLRDADGPLPPWLPSEVRTLALSSPAALWRYLRASEVYFTHGLFGSVRPVKTQVVANLWHGMPIKSIDPALGVRGPGCTFTVATSAAFAPSLATCFHLDESSVEVIGLPRNDVLTDPTIGDAEAVRRELAVSGYLMMLPTYRQSSMGPGRIDSSDDNLRIDAGDLALLDEVLRAHDLALVVKPHPVSPPGVLDSWASDRVVVISDRWLVERDLTLYGVLGGAQLLVTDYSSAAVDFLVTGRPCVLFQPDLDTYQHNRGLTLPPAAMDTLGEAVADVPSLVAAIARAAEAAFTRTSPVSDALWSTAPTGATERVLAAVAARRRGGRR